MTETATLVRSEVRRGIACVTLAAPPYNLLTGAMMDALTEALDAAQADRSLTGILVAAEGKAFSAGADVGEHRPGQAPTMIAAFSRLFTTIGALELPLVAAVHGAALGAGFELAMMADIVVASERATFGQPEIRLGFFAPVGVSWLPARIGIARTVEVTATGRTYSAAEMQAMGLVTRVVPTEGLDAAVETVLDDLRRASPAVMRLNVRTARRLAGRTFEEGHLEAERVFLEELMPLADVREGIASFYEKRAAVWQNR